MKRTGIKRVAFFLVLVMLASLLNTSCNNMSKEDYEALYGREIFSCSSKNIIGFKGAYIDDGNRVTYVFDEKYAMSNKDANLGIKKLFTEEVYTSDEYFVVGKGIRPINVDGKDVEINRDTMTISVIIDDGVEPEEIDGFAIFTDFEFYNVNFNSDQFGTVITANTHRENNTKHYSYVQIYDESRNKWGNASKTEFTPSTG